jgi:hypothetical protein
MYNIYCFSHLSQRLSFQIIWNSWAVLVEKCMPSLCPYVGLLAPCRLLYILEIIVQNYTLTWVSIICFQYCYACRTHIWTYWMISIMRKNSIPWVKNLLWRPCFYLIKTNKDLLRYLSKCHYCKVWFKLARRWSTFWKYTGDGHKVITIG